MKKVVVKLDLHDDKAKQKAMKAVSSITGIESIEMDMNNKKMTVIGDIDPVDVVTKLKKKKWYAEILTVGPAKEPEKKKEEPKKEEPKKEDEKKKQEELIASLVKAYEAYNPHLTKHYHVVSMEENPNACVIC